MSNTRAAPDLSSRLPAALPPNPRESLLGYLFRLATVNGYKSIYRLVTAAKLKMSDLKKLEAKAVERLGVFLELDTLEIRHIGDQIRVGRQIYRYGHRIMQYQLRKGYAKICPDCLKEKLLFDSLWDLDLFIACPEHGTYLLEICPACRRRLQWSRPEWNKCCCGADLTRAVTQVAPMPVVEYCETIARKFRYLQLPNNQLHVSGELSRFCLSDFIQSVFFCGKLKLNFWRKELLDNHGKARLIIGGLQFFDDIEAEFSSVTRRYLNKNSKYYGINTLHSGMRFSLFRQIMEFLPKNKKFISKQFMLAIHRLQYKSFPCFLTSDHVLSNGRNNSFTSITIKDLRESVPSNGLLPEFVLVRRQNGDPAFCRELPAFPDDSISLQEMATLLGVPERFALGLLNAGSFSKCKIDLHSRVQIVTPGFSYIRNVLNELNSVTANMSCHRSRKKSFHEVMKLGSCLALPAGRIVDEILSMNIKAYKKSNFANFADISLCSQDVCRRLLCQ